MQVKQECKRKPLKCNTIFSPSFDLFDTSIGDNNFLLFH